MNKNFINLESIDDTFYRFRASPIGLPLGKLYYMDFVYGNNSPSSNDLYLSFRLNLTGAPLRENVYYFIYNNGRIYYKLTFKGYSRIEGLPIFKVQPTGATGVVKDGFGDLPIQESIEEGQILNHFQMSIGTFYGKCEFIRSIEDHLPNLN